MRNNGTQAERGQPPIVLRRLLRGAAIGLGVPLLRVAERTGWAPDLVRFLLQRAPISLEKLQESFAGYQPSGHDVFVCTYAKSGTNWMLQIAYQVAHHGAGEFEHIHDVVPWPDEIRPHAVGLDNPATWQHAPTGLRVIKTHLAWEHVPYTEAARYICVLRDPKDVFVSSYHFVRDLVFGPLMPAVETWLHLFLSDDYAMGAWPEHVHSYWQQRHRPNLLIVTFAEMKADLPAVVRRVAAFIGVALSPAEVEIVSHKSSFTYMQGIDHKFYPPFHSPLGNEGGRMMRAGQTGSAKILLSPQQRQRIDEHCRRRLQQLGSDLPYDAWFANGEGG